MNEETQTPSPEKQGGFLNFVEKVGNILPDPTTLFVLGTIFILILSHIAFVGEWEVKQELPEAIMETVTVDGQEVTRPKLDENGEPIVNWKATGKSFKATSLLDRDGFFWVIDNLVDNFMDFAPLGVVLVGMLGIGLSEKVGLIAAILKAFLLIVPKSLLTPAMIFMGIMSSMGLDAGYVVLPPLAAALYKSVGRSPLAGLAAVFAGVAAGFNANLFITGLDPMLAAFSNTGAQLINPDYQVSPTSNWFFLIVSTFVITLVGWATTSMIVEKRLKGKSPEDGGPVIPTKEELEQQEMKPEEKSGLIVAGITFFVMLGLILVFKFWGSYELVDGKRQYTGGFLYDITLDPDKAHEYPEGFKEATFPRWVSSIVPLLFLCFLSPGIAYGIKLKKIKNDKDIAKLLIESIANMAPIIVLSFFAAQFISGFKHSGLGQMLALSGGQFLGQAELSPMLLIVAFILVTFIFNLLIGSMSAKYALFAPIFVPMFMLVGISPELTQAAYRIGDSTSNIITPLNPYMIIVLVFMQKLVPRGGTGTLIATMLPYTVVFTIVWTILLLLWMFFGIPLGPESQLWYSPGGGG